MDAVESSEPGPLRVVVEEAVAPGGSPRLPEIEVSDPRLLSAARRLRRGGYLRLPVTALRKLGRSVVLLDRFVRGTDLVLRVRTLPARA